MVKQIQFGALLEDEKTTAKTEKKRYVCVWYQVEISGIYYFYLNLASRNGRQREGCKLRRWILRLRCIRWWIQVDCRPQLFRLSKSTKKSKQYDFSHMFKQLMQLINNHAPFVNFYFLLTLLLS